MVHSQLFKMNMKTVQWNLFSPFLVAVGCSISFFKFSEIQKHVILNNTLISDINTKIVIRT